MDKLIKKTKTKTPPLPKKKKPQKNISDKPMNRKKIIINSI